MSYIGSAPSRNTPAYKQVYEFVATVGQTTFSVAYTVGFVEVYRNGVKLGAPNFTANNGTSVVLTSGANAGDFIQIVSEFINPVLNAIPNTTGAVATNNIADNAITTAKIAAGAVIAADIASGQTFALNGVQFPATQVPSADANTLDDYEEGTWTPVYSVGTINGAGKVYSGRYTKIGRTVTATFYATATDQNLQVVGYVGFTGLPFSAIGDSAGAVTTEDIDIFSRNGFCGNNSGTSFFLSACGSAGGTNTLIATVTYFTS